MLLGGHHQAYIRAFLTVLVSLIDLLYYPLQISTFSPFCHSASAISWQPRCTLINAFWWCCQSCIRAFLTDQISFIDLPYYPLQISIFSLFCHSTSDLSLQQRGALINGFRGRFQACVRAFLTVQNSLVDLPYFVAGRCLYSNEVNNVKDSFLPCEASALFQQVQV